jgi:hypothetical protein
MNPQTKIGIDRTSGGVRIASVEHENGRPVVRKLDYLADVSSIGDTFAGVSQRWAVADNEVIVKALYLRAADESELRSRCLFELQRSVIEPREKFDFDVLVPTHGQGQVGLIYRRALLDRLLAGGESSSLAHRSWLVRSAALALGFLTFGRHIPGELIALADIADRLVSVCLVFKRDILSLTHVVMHGLDLRSSPAVARLAIEFKTVLNFKLAELSSRGMTLPLSALYVTGDQVSADVREVFSHYFPLGVTAPEINEAYFPEHSGSAQDLAGYLVALGLAVN